MIRPQHRALVNSNEHVGIFAGPPQVVLRPQRWEVRNSNERSGTSSAPLNPVLERDK